MNESLIDFSDPVSSPEPYLPDELINMLGILDDSSDLRTSEPEDASFGLDQQRHVLQTPSPAPIVIPETPSPEMIQNNSSDNEDDPEYILETEEDANVNRPSEESGSDSEGEICTEITSAKTSKRQRHLEMWPRTIKKKNRESGKSYTNEKGKNFSARESNGVCCGHCTFGCGRQMIKEEQVKIFNHFWKLSDDKKLHFYSKFIHRSSASRKRTEAEISKKKFSYTYHFEVLGVNVKVCREFFLSVLNVSKQRVYYFFKTKFNCHTGIAYSPTKGKYIKKAVEPRALDGVRSHIISFPTMESHYCRASSSKKYLDARLSVGEMHRLYLKSKYVYDNKPVKLSKYRSIFLLEFNLSFHHPKKDRCDHCEEFKVISQPTQEQQIKYDLHISRKKEGNEERDNDRAQFMRGSTDIETMVISFDMEKVIALPKAEISSFFYLRKLNCYNLTAHCSLDGVTYCALWNEALSGRAGNHIASAMIKILYAVQEAHPQFKKLILWSDSCVPQNKNSVMSTAISLFLADDKVTIRIIEQKFGEPGHGNIQEVDAIHSKLERGLKTSEIFSPLSLVRRLVKLTTTRAPLKIIQLKMEDFLNYQGSTAGLNFNLIPYMKVKHLIYKSDEPMHISYRISFTGVSIAVRLGRTATSSEKKKSPSIASPLFKKVFPINKPAILAPEKVNDIKKMFKFMPAVDVAYYKALLKL